MKTKDLLKTTPETLALAQRNAIRNDVLDLLDKLKVYIETSNYTKAKEMFMFSPAGDDHGLDNHCLDCSEIVSDGSDLYDCIEMMEKLTAQATITKGDYKYPPLA